MSAQLAIQEMFYDLLKNDAQLSSKISGVFDAHPEPQKFPYITIGDGYSNQFTTFNRMGEEVFFNVHVWSRYKGFKEGHEISSDIFRLLAQQHLDIPSFGSVACFFESSETLRDIDGITRHLILRFRLLIQN
jgi:hypothetical protein